MCLIGLASLSEVIIFCIKFVKLLKKHPGEAEPELDLEIGAGPSKIEHTAKKFFVFMVQETHFRQVEVIFSPGPFGTP